MARESIKPTQTRFGKLLKEARERAPRMDGGLGYSQKEVEELSLKLADKFPHCEPISHSHLSSVESGRHRMTDAMLRMLIYLYKMDDTTIVNLMKLPEETVNVRKPVPLYVQGSTPNEALPLLQQFLSWASQGAALEQFNNQKAENSSSNITPNFSADIMASMFEGHPEGFNGLTPKEQIMAEQDAEVRVKTPRTAGRL